MKCSRIRIAYNIYDKCDFSIAKAKNAGCFFNRTAFRSLIIMLRPPSWPDSAYPGTVTRDRGRSRIEELFLRIPHLPPRFRSGFSARRRYIMKFTGEHHAETEIRNRCPSDGAGHDPDLGNHLHLHQSAAAGVFADRNPVPALSARFCGPASGPRQTAVPELEGGAALRRRGADRRNALFSVRKHRADLYARLERRCAGHGRAVLHGPALLFLPARGAARSAFLRRFRSCARRSHAHHVFRAA